MKRTIDMLDILIAGILATVSLLVIPSLWVWRKVMPHISVPVRRVYLHG